MRKRIRESNKLYICKDCQNHEINQRRVENSFDVEHRQVIKSKNDDKARDIEKRR